jgi:hypothetical protein
MTIPQTRLDLRVNAVAFSYHLSGLSEGYELALLLQFMGDIYTDFAIA